MAAQRLGRALLRQCQGAKTSQAPALAAAVAEGEPLLRRCLEYYFDIRDKALRGTETSTCSLGGAQRAVLQGRHVLGQLLECSGRLEEARALFAKNFASALLEHGPCSRGRFSWDIGERGDFVGSFEHEARVLCKLGRFEEAAALAAAQVDAPPPLPASFAGLCDRVGCRSGILWRPRGPHSAPPRLEACPTCKMAAYCSDSCRRAAWTAGHRELCGRLNPAPRPLRLVAPRLDGDALLRAGLDGTPLACLRPGDEQHANLQAAQLDRLLAQRDAKRALLVVHHPWKHTLTGAGTQSKRGNVSVFEIMPSGSARLSARVMSEASRDVLEYIFQEEDRVAREPAARYEKTGMFVRVGMMLPPDMAASKGAKTDEQGRVTSIGGLGMPAGLEKYTGGLSVVDGGGMGIMIGPVARWATTGPFHCSEMTLHDISLESLDVIAPRAWPQGWLAVLPRYSA